MPDPTLQEVLDAYEAEWPMGPGHPGTKRREMFTRTEVAVLVDTLRLAEKTVAALLIQAAEIVERAIEEILDDPGDGPAAA